MATAITFHAIERLQERREVTHLLRHINKIKKWDMPANGDYYHKGWRYVLRGGVIITCFYEPHKDKEWRGYDQKENN